MDYDSIVRRLQVISEEIKELGQISRDLKRDKDNITDPDDKAMAEIQIEQINKRILDLSREFRQLSDQFTKGMKK